MLTKKKLPAKKKKEQIFPIIAIGSSAGGLQAVTTLLHHLPADTGMAIIYAQHLNPHEKSLTVSILSGKTTMKVQEIEQMELIKPDNVYVIPNDRDIQVTDGHIRLVTREKSKGSNFSIDKLFISLAETHSVDVIGIVLSGNATDGTLGLRAIKSHGGITFAQDSSAKNQSMPVSAIEDGAVDYILSPKQIAAKIERLATQFKKNGSLHFESKTGGAITEKELKKILDVVYDTTGVDFSLYKTSTIHRRILRRILLNNMSEVREYVALLSEDKKEAEVLYRDLLINYTTFFRDKDTFDYLKRTLLPRLMKNRNTLEPLRIWTVACATGEEAYSLAIVIQEILDDHSAAGKIQIFATDLSAPSIEKARLGLFTKEELAEVAPERIKNFFTPTPQGYRVKKAIREMCVFAPHNILSEPPFSHLDLICCCNMLIYLDIQAQQKVMSVFHYALKTGGYLILGRSETIGGSGYLFDQYHNKLKIFKSRRHSSKPLSDKPRPKFSAPYRSIRDPDMVVTSKTSSDDRSIGSRIDSILLERTAPACVVINYEGEIILFRGVTTRYLRNAEGKASLNIIKMARSELAFGLQALIRNAIRSRKDVKHPVIELIENGRTDAITMEAIQLAGPGQIPLLLILFTETAVAQLNDKLTRSAIKSSADTTIKNLRQQLSMLQKETISMHTTHENATQDLQAANEEVVSANEELQSLNEELETSREEIQSTNEELNATIQELLTQNRLLSESYSYSEEIFSTLHEAMIVLDHDLKVKTANAAFYQLFQPGAGTVEGLPFLQMNNGMWDLPQLKKILSSIRDKSTNITSLPLNLKLQGNKGVLHLLLNAKQIIQQSHKKNLILLAITEVPQKRTVIKKSARKK